MRNKNTDFFEPLALRLFRHQAVFNPIYSQYIKLLGISEPKVKKLKDIPFLPIQLFKSKKIITNHQQHQHSILFQSSGTTQQQRSKHYVTDISLYEKSFTIGFQKQYGPITDYAFLCLLPSYLENGQSSLVYMAQKLITASRNPASSFYLNNYAQLTSTVQQLEKIGQKYIILGVTYALMDLADFFEYNGVDPLKFGIVMETGGMKGRRAEMVKEALHLLLCSKFKIDTIHSEYGMTELLSQAYSKGNGRFYSPDWMQVFVREINDPFSTVEVGGVGALNIIDLANKNSCAFIATDDIGKKFSDDSFEIIGRIDDSDLRGCNLLVDL